MRVLARSRVGCEALRPTPDGRSVRIAPRTRDVREVAWTRDGRGLVLDVEG